MFLSVVASLFLVGFLILVCWNVGMNPAPAKESPFFARNTFNLASITVGSQTGSGSGATRNVAVQLKDANANSIKTVGSCLAYLSDSADGHTLTSVTPTSVAIGTNGVVLAALVAAKVFEIISNASGQFDLTITESGTPNSYYLCVRMPDGSLQISPVIAMT